MLRGFNSKKEPIVEISYDEMLKGLGLNHKEFVDMCILCGCDYSVTIDGKFWLLKEESLRFIL